MTAHQIQTRLGELKAELAAGESALADLDAQREHLVATLLRLSGAIQVLGEFLADDAGETAPSPTPGAAV